MQGGDGTRFEEQATGPHAKETRPQNMRWNSIQTGEVSHVSDYDASLGLYGRGGKGGGSGKKGESISEISLKVKVKTPLPKPLPSLFETGLPGRLRSPRWSSSRMDFTPATKSGRRPEALDGTRVEGVPGTEVREPNWYVSADPHGSESAYRLGNRSRVKPAEDPHTDPNKNSIHKDRKEDEWKRVSRAKKIDGSEYGHGAADGARAARRRKGRVTRDT